MDPIKSETMLSYFTSQFDKLMSISYEQVNLNDRFGQVMLNNLTSRGCGLAGYDACESVQTQQERFLNCGFQESKCELMSDIYESLPGRTDIEKLEFLDDVDIFKQLLQHYSITASSNSAIFDAIVCKFYSLNCPRPKMGWVDTDPHNNDEPVKRNLRRLSLSCAFRQDFGFILDLKTYLEEHVWDSYVVYILRRSELS